MAEKVVITGMGMVSPLGKGVRENWNNLCYPSPEASAHPLPKGRGHTAVGLPPLGGRWSPDARRPDEGLNRAEELSFFAAAEALSNAGLWDGQSLQPIDPERVGCTVSASKPFFASPEFSVAPPEVINDFISSRFGLRGERRNVIAACATGAYSIALGASWIQEGLCDVVVAGSVEPYPHPLIQAGFKQMGVLSGESVTRPFDLCRSGFTFGEGAGVVILEAESSARRRRAKMQGWLTGWALGADTHSAVAFNSNGARIADVIGRALERGGHSPADVNHVNAHGTGTRLNDWIETQALLKAFGSRAEHLMISATKASTGHLLGASGSVEFIFTLLALQEQFVPPTRTLETVDPECPLDYTPKKGHPAPLEHALSLSFGFGGPIGALVVSR